MSVFIYCYTLFNFAFLENFFGTIFLWLCERVCPSWLRSDPLRLINPTSPPLAWTSAFWTPLAKPGEFWRDRYDKLWAKPPRLTLCGLRWGWRVSCYKVIEIPMGRVCNIPRNEGVRWKLLVLLLIPSLKYSRYLYEIQFTQRARAWWARPPTQNTKAKKAHAQLWNGPKPNGG